jgi:hypothetical protein
MAGKALQNRPSRKLDSYQGPPSGMPKTVRDECVFRRSEVRILLDRSIGQINQITNLNPSASELFVASCRPAVPFQP